MQGTFIELFRGALAALLLIGGLALCARIADYFLIGIK